MAFLCPKLLIFSIKHRRRDSFDRRFSGRIDIQNQHNIRQIEGAREVVEQMHRARVAVRLKDRKDPTEIAGLRGAERRANFRGMVRIVVDHGDAVAALDLKSAVHALKVLQSRGNDGRLDAHVACGSKRGSGVQNVVHAGNVQLESSGWFLR